MRKKLYYGLAFILASSFVQSTHAATCERYDSLSAKQKHNLQRAYLYGAPDNLGYTLAAIALQESNAGQWRVSFRTNDYGLMQINVTTAVNTMGVTNYYRQMELIERIIHDDSLSLTIALSVLDHFRQGRQMTNDVWREMVMRYNVGWRSTNGRGEKYLQSVSHYVNLLQQCTKWGNLNEPQ